MSDESYITGPELRTQDLLDHTLEVTLERLALLRDYLRSQDSPDAAADVAALREMVAEAGGWQRVATRARCYQLGLLLELLGRGWHEYLAVHQTTATLQDLTLRDSDLPDDDGDGQGGGIDPGLLL